MWSRATPTSSEGLLGPNAQRLELALISAGTAATLRRILDDIKPDSVRMWSALGVPLG